MPLHLQNKILYIFCGFCCICLIHKNQSIKLKCIYSKPNRTNLHHHIHAHLKLLMIGKWTEPQCGLFSWVIPTYLLIVSCGQTALLHFSLQFEHLRLHPRVILYIVYHSQCNTHKASSSVQGEVNHPRVLDPHMCPLKVKPIKLLLMN